jgi:hypothetical protein
MSVLRAHFAACLAFLCACSSIADAVEVLPAGRLFRLTFADPQEIRMVLSVDRGDKLYAIVGNYFSLLGFGTQSKEGFQAHFGLEGRGFFTMRQEQSRFPLETVDGMVGAYVDAQYQAFQMQIRYTHVSGHLADGLVGTPTAFSREYTSLRMGYAPSGDFHFYFGASHIANSYPSVQPWGAQVGGSYFFPTGIVLAPFAAFDLHWRQEWMRTGIAVQLGLALNKPANRYRSFRLFYGFYNGGDMRGQFFGQPVTSHSVGLEMQI